MQIILIHQCGMTKSFNRTIMLAANVGITRNVVNAVNRTKHSIRFITSVLRLLLALQASPNQPKNLTYPRRSSTMARARRSQRRWFKTQCTKSWNIVRPCSVYGPGDRDFLNLLKLLCQGIQHPNWINDAPLNMIHVTQLADFYPACHRQSSDFRRDYFFATDNQYIPRARSRIQSVQQWVRHRARIIIPEALAYGAFAISDVWADCSNSPEL
jgi:nucleoside-diphosphate-sugar epimerase